MSLREHVSLREHACVSSRGAQSTELVWILDFKQILFIIIIMASVINTFFIDKIDNIRAEFPLLEANLPSYSFLSIDSIMSMCPTGLHHFEPVIDTERLKIISCMNKTTCSSNPFPTRLLMSHIHAIVPILQHIVNLCLTTGDFPILCKSSIVNL